MAGRGSTSNPAQNTQTAVNPANPPATSNDPKDPKNNKPKDKEAEPQEETKDNAKKMGWKGLGGRLLNFAKSDFSYQGIQGNHFNLLGLFSQKEQNESDETEKKVNLTPKELLGMIYKAMVKLDTYRKLQYEEYKNHLQEQNLDKNRKHKEIIKALMTLVPKKPEEPEEKANTANTSASTAGTPGTPSQQPATDPKTNTTSASASPKTNTTSVSANPKTSTASAETPKNKNASQQTTSKQTTTQQANTQPGNKQTAEPNNTGTYTPAILTSARGFRADQFDSKKQEYHTGTDWHAPQGTKVYAKGTGVVSEVGEKKENGKFIRIQYDNERDADYLHLSDTSAVKKGDKVEAGTFIGKTGNTGKSKNPHLHLGLHDRKGNLLNPTKEEIEYTLNSPDIVNKHKEEIKEQKSPPKKEAVDNNNVNTKNAPPVSPVSTVEDTKKKSASKVPDLMPDGKVQLQDNDFGYSGFFARKLSKVEDPNKLQRDYKGNWYYEDGTLVTDQKKKNSAERRWIFNTYGLLAGTKIDAKELKTIGLTGEAIKNTDGLWHIINDNIETIVKDKETINKLEKLGKSKFVASLENNIGDTVDTLSFENKNYKQDFIASSSETTNNQNVIIMKKNNINMNNEKVDDNNPYTQKLG